MFKSTVSCLTPSVSLLSFFYVDLAINLSLSGRRWRSPLPPHLLLPPRSWSAVGSQASAGPNLQWGDWDSPMAILITNEMIWNVGIVHTNPHFLKLFESRCVHSSFTHTHTRTHTRAHIYIYIYTHTCIHICIYNYTYVHMYISTLYTCIHNMHIYMCTYMHIYIYRHVHINTYAYVQAFTKNIYIHTYIYIYTYTYIQNTCIHRCIYAYVSHGDLHSGRTTGAKISFPRREDATRAARRSVAASWHRDNASCDTNYDWMLTWWLPGRCWEFQIDEWFETKGSSNEWDIGVETKGRK